MKATRFAFLILAFLVVVSGFEKQAEAGTDFFLGFSYYHPAYHYYYRPYSYWHGYWGPYWGPGYYNRPYYYRPYGRVYYYGYGEIRLEVKPKTAKVYVNGDYVGIVDDFDSWYQRLEIEPGKHKIVIREEGYQPLVETLRILPGRNYHIKEQLQPGEDRLAERDMMTDRDTYGEYEREPYQRDRDRRYDSDRSRGQNPSRDEQYRNQPQDAPKGRETRTLLLQVNPRDATIYIDGNYYGTADIGESGELQVLLPKGEHRLEIVRPGYESFSKEIQVDENSNEKIVINLQKK
jgi:hypothetical protein